MYKVINVAILWLLVSMVACSSSPPAPVIDRLPDNKSSKVDVLSNQKNKNTNRPAYKAGDWRPDTYQVKKGDTLFSIGLEFGYYYKDIAQVNNIVAPYNIRVGQLLKLKPLKEKVAGTENKPNQANDGDGVEITPINTESASSAVAIGTGSVILITGPKMTRESYSEDALKKTPTKAPIVTNTAKVNTPEVTSPSTEVKQAGKIDAKSSESKPNTESPEDIDWVWPTKGKIIESFNESGNKGIDISGTMGQSVNAAAAGRVIYSGSDLRGYGKLVIIKHNSTYLSVYAHNSQILVKEGQQISKGQSIAEMGNTDSNSVKLHFEIRRQGKSVDPSKYLASN